MLKKQDSTGAYLGEAATLETNDSIKMLNQLIVKLPDFLPPFLEKLNLYLSIQNWSEVLDTADRILSINAECTLAIMVITNIVTIIELYKIVYYFYF